MSWVLLKWAFAVAVGSGCAIRAISGNLCLVIINPGSSRLHAATIRIDDPGPLSQYIGSGHHAYIHGTDGFVAMGEIARLNTHDMAEATRWWDSIVETIENDTEMPGMFGTGPIACGSFVFDPTTSQQTSVLTVPRTVIGRYKDTAWLTQIGYNHVTPTMPTPVAPPSAPRGLRFTNGSVEDSQWKSIVADVVARIQAGEASKVVLARDIVARADEEIDLRWAFDYLCSAYGSCWNYLVDGLVGSTPEMLVRREDGLTSSRVLAGTIQRVEGVDDAQQASRLLASAKDRAEHQMAVDSVVASLGAHLKALHVAESPFVLPLPNVMHLATDICGISEADVSTLTLAQAAHPSAAICGTPTDTARRIIAECEGMDRGRFAGVVGWMDSTGDGEWALALRCGQLCENDPTAMRLFAGAGVVAQSDPHAELVETEAKLAPMKAALRDRRDA